jgi:hypothetical protein
LEAKIEVIMPRPVLVHYESHPFSFFSDDPLIALLKEEESTQI